MCDTCMVPGHCCRSLTLGGGRFGSDLNTIEEVEAELRSERYGTPIAPFRALYKRSDGTWLFWCPNLDQRTGRCLDYDNRPHACSNYKPGHDGLCVHYWKAEGDSEASHAVVLAAKPESSDSEGGEG